MGNTVSLEGLPKKLESVGCRYLTVIGLCFIPTIFFFLDPSLLTFLKLFLTTQAQGDVAVFFNCVTCKKFHFHPQSRQRTTVKNPKT